MIGRSMKFANRLGLSVAFCLAFCGRSWGEPYSAPTVYNGLNHSRVYFHDGPSAFADEVFEFRPGKKKSPELWRKPEAAVGAPDFRDFEADRLSRKPTFLGLGANGSVILRFTDNALIDGPGADLYIFEPLNNVTPVSVEVSRDGTNWISLGPALTTACEIDIGGKGGAGGNIFHFVRIKDASLPDFADQWPGADIDAVGAINSAPQIVVPSKTLWNTNDQSASSKTTVIQSQELKPIFDRFASLLPRSVQIDMFQSSDDSFADGRLEQIRTCLSTDKKILPEKLTTKSFAGTMSIARRQVEKELERDGRVEFVFIPYDRDTVSSGSQELKNEQGWVLMDGKWKSEMGDVILMARPSHSNQVEVSGEWLESPGRKNVIQSGVFDTTSGMLNFTWYRSWNNVHGKSQFQLSIDSNKLRGRWKGETGQADTEEAGEWVLVR